MTSLVQRPELLWRPPGDLSLDPQNPRLAGHHFDLDDQVGIAGWLWKNKAVKEIVDSISASGFWTHEELFACEESGRMVVVEGNRRLAAVKILVEEDLRSKLGISLELPTPEVLESLRELPVLVESRKQIWEFIGFKHVNGPQVWDSLAKAEYVHRVHTEFGVSLSEIARAIGDENDTVKRLYRGLLVLNQAKDQGLFDPEDSMQKKFPFSHLWTALGYSSVQSFLGVDTTSLLRPDPVPAEKMEHLSNLMLWLFGSRSREIDPKIRRQTPDLRNLIESLGTPKGVQALRAGLPLTAALEASLGDERLFQDALLKAEEELRAAKRFVATGYRGEDHLMETAEAIETISRSLRREMNDMRTTSRDTD
jgi:hypothetical protein